MSRNEETYELHARLVAKTELAVQLTAAKNPGELDAHPPFWLPRSQIGRTSIIQVPPDYPVFRCQVPAWMVEKDKLWDFVKS